MKVEMPVGPSKRGAATRASKPMAVAEKAPGLRLLVPVLVVPVPPSELPRAAQAQAFTLVQGTWNW